MSEEKNEVDYMQPTKFWENQSLEMLWAHLQEECDEAMKEVIPLLRFKGPIPDDMAISAGMELVDVQIQSNTVNMKLDCPPVKEEYLYPMLDSGEIFPVSIIKFVESRAKAGIKFRDYMRGSAHVEDLKASLVNLILHADNLLFWMFPNSERRRVIRYKVFRKNEARGYYL